MRSRQRIGQFLFMGHLVQPSLAASALRALTLLVLLLVAPLSSSYGQSKADAQIGDLKERFLKLRNTDNQLKQDREWLKLGEQMEKMAQELPKHPESPDLLFDAAIVYAEMFNHFSVKEFAQKSIELNEKIARDYPGHPLADDALIRKGETLMYKLSERDAARRSFLEVVEAYPKSDMLAVARHRLNELDSGNEIDIKSQTEPSEDLSVKQGQLVVVIDPGHGGEDYGAPGVGGLLEKDVVLSIALQLEKILQEELSAAVRLTRRTDVFVPLIERTNLANDFEADLFISLHANSSPSGKLSGFETYYLDNSDDQASRKLAERENRSIEFEGPQGDLRYMLSDLIQSAKMEDSLRLANAIQLATYNHLKKDFSIGRNFGVKRAPFYVLVGAHMPCVLVEMGFINNTSDGSNLADPKYREQLAYGVFLGVKSFLGKAPDLTTSTQ
ncbi:MAG: N-acetylmuramoyl-L-alanine amidase [Bdellovibrionales bacterium]|nr:N-acetylmuramoyl-L-alanine amidase [Bdellovibrionales bacterium]